MNPNPSNPPKIPKTPLGNQQVSGFLLNYNKTLTIFYNPQMFFHKPAKIQDKMSLF